MSDLVSQNRELLAKVADLQKQLAQEVGSDYRQAWLAVVAALDASASGWRSAGPTQVVAAVATIKSVTFQAQIGWLAVRDTDTQFVLTEMGAKSFDSQGYTLLPVYGGDWY